ncbi:MAG: hypothetical protein OEV28_12785 [Nitrospirota bacterium]|nr:hypothetical protein [Nitrospirota bacterium]
MSLQGIAWTFLHVVFLALLYFVPKYLYRYLGQKRLRCRYKMALAGTAVGSLQVIMCAIGLFPGLLLLYPYLFIISLATWREGYAEPSHFIYWLTVISQIPFYAMIGLLFGIFEESNEKA